MRILFILSFLFSIGPAHASQKSVLGQQACSSPASCWQFLIKSNHCVACNLSGLDVQHGAGGALDLKTANISRANFSRSEIADLDLSQANLSGVNLSGVQFYRVNFSGANLSQAIAKGATFHDCRFDGANLSEANFSGAHFNGGSLNLTHATMNQRTSFEGASFTGTLIKVDGNSTTQACLSGQKMTLKNLSLENLFCEGKQFANTSFTNVVFSGGSFKRASFANARLWNVTTQEDVDFRDVQTSHARIKGDFRGALVNASLKGDGVDLTDALFTKNQQQLITGGTSGTPIDSTGHGTYTFVCDRSLQISSLPFYGALEKSVVEFFHKKLALPRTAQTLKDNLPLVTAFVAVMASYYAGLIDQQSIAGYVGSIAAGLPEGSVRDILISKKDMVVQFILTPSTYIAFGSFFAPVIKDFREMDYRAQFKAFVASCQSASQTLRGYLGRLKGA
ncbi:MAG: pentapeptide repeat-containing protein [Holosporales bacterium]